MADEPPVDQQASPPPAPRRESIAELFRRLIDDIVALVRSEVQLARNEFVAGVTAASGSLAAVAIGAMLAMVATIFLLVALVAFLATKVGLVAAALIIAGTFMVVALGLMLYGIAKLRQLDLAPKRAAANLKRNADLLKGD